jgi:hypothetical protein
MLPLHKQKQSTMQHRPLFVIANEIKQDWKKPYFGAVPYLEAMQCLNSIEDNYFMDSAKTIIVYFLANATTWKGEKAREIKKELNKLIK